MLGGALGTAGGSYYFFAVAEFDPTQPLFGFPDPTIVYVAGALALGGAGAGAGVVGVSQLWRLTRSR